MNEEKSTADTKKISPNDGITVSRATVPPGWQLPEAVDELPNKTDTYYDPSTTSWEEEATKHIGKRRPRFVSVNLINRTGSRTSFRKLTMNSLFL